MSNYFTVSINSIWYDSSYVSLGYTEILLGRKREAVKEFSIELLPAAMFNSLLLAIVFNFCKLSPFIIIIRIDC